MIGTTRIPTHRNNGTKISRRELRQILAKIRIEFNGYSLEGPSDGAWVSSDGEIYEEKSYKLEVVVAHARMSELREAFVNIGKQLGQRAIFFEAREGGEIIDLE